MKDNFLDITARLLYNFCRPKNYYFLLPFGSTDNDLKALLRNFGVYNDIKKLYADANDARAFVKTEPFFKN